MCETNGTSVDICATPTMKIVKKKARQENECTCKQVGDTNILVVGYEHYNNNNQEPC